MILSRSTKRACSVRLRARLINSVRCSAEHDNATATRVTRHLSWYADPRYHTKYRTSTQLSTSCGIYREFHRFRSRRRVKGSQKRYKSIPYGQSTKHPNREFFAALQGIK